MPEIRDWWCVAFAAAGAMLALVAGAMHFHLVEKHHRQLPTGVHAAFWFSILLGGAVMAVGISASLSTG